MTTTHASLDPHVIAQLTGLELQARMIVEGFVSGWHKSPFHGFSVEFAEHREYVPGDDLRYVDWKVFGKSDRYYLKQYDEETNYACHFLVDSSGSMSYQSRGAPLSKWQYARAVAAALAFVVQQQSDAIGLATFTSDVATILGPGSKPSHFQQFCHVLETTQLSGETSLGPVLHDLAERIRKRGLIVLLSDLFDDIDALQMGLKHFRHRRHDVIVLQVVDPAEQDFPFLDPTLFHGLELEPDVQTDTKSLRRAYQAEFQGFLTDVRRICHDLQIDYHLLRTDQSLGTALQSVLVARNRRA